MSEAYPMWAEVQAASNEDLLHEVGLLMFGREDSKILAEARESMEVERVDFQEVSTVEDGPRLLNGEKGLLVREGGWVAADRVWSAIRSLVSAGGGRIEMRHVESCEDLRDFDRYIIAAGPWIKDWVPDLDVEVTLQTFAYCPTATPVGGPVWIHDTPEFFYGFPSEAGVGIVKVGVHTAGRCIGSGDDCRAPETEHLEAIGREAAGRFDVLARDLTGYGCLYTSTANEDFRIGHLDDRGTFISACSGHAFKMGPWLGSLMADLMEDEQSLDDWPRFRWPRV